MTGGNREAAEMSGVNTRQVIMLTLMISGLTAGMAGMLYGRAPEQRQPGCRRRNCSSTRSRRSSLAALRSSAARAGSRTRSLASLIFGILSNGLNLLPNISIYFKHALQGIILVGALLLNVLALRLERVQTRTE